MNPVGWLHAGDPEDFDPTFQHPIPTLRSVEPAQRRTAGAAGLVVARVTFSRIGQVRSEGWIYPLILHELGFGGEGKARGKIAQARDIEGNSRGVELSGIKPVAGKELCHQRTK